jgi:hypothetical protein
MPEFLRQAGSLPRKAQSCLIAGQPAFQSGTPVTLNPAGSDNLRMSRFIAPSVRSGVDAAAWTMQFWATAHAEPGRLVQSLTGAILGCGGWVLSRGASDSGAVHMVFEFEREICEDIYSVLIASGLNLSPAGHYRLTELCRCTRQCAVCRRAEIVSIDLDIETFPAEPQEFDALTTLIA